MERACCATIICSCTRYAIAGERDATDGPWSRATLRITGQPEQSSAQQLIPVSTLGARPIRQQALESARRLAATRRSAPKTPAFSLWALETAILIHLA